VSEFTLRQRVVCGADLTREDGSVAVPAGTRGSIVDYYIVDTDGEQWYFVVWDSDPGNEWPMCDGEMTAVLDNGPLRDVGGEA